MTTRGWFVGAAILLLVGVVAIPLVSGSKTPATIAVVVAIAGPIILSLIGVLSSFRNRR